MRSNTKQIMITSTLFGFLLCYFAHRVVLVYESLPGSNIMANINSATSMVVGEIQKRPLDFSFSSLSLKVSVVTFIGVLLVALYYCANPRNYRAGIEHGSARWGTAKDAAPFKDRKPENNYLLTQTESLTSASRLPRWKRKYERNKSLLVVGGAGSGKTFGFIKPNLMQMNCSYVVTESKNLLPHETGKMFLDAGYKLKIFDLDNQTNCDKFNPFHYINSEQRLLMVVKNLMKNTDDGGAKQKSGDPFWDKSETAFYCAIFSYLVEVADPSEQTLPMVSELIREARIDSEDDNLVSPLDILFEDLRQEQPDHFAVKQYDTFKLAPPKTARSILICASVRLMPFDIPSVADLVSEDTMDLDMIGDRKTVVFVCMPDTHSTFNFLAAMLFDMMFMVLVDRADNFHGGFLPNHIRYMMDEFANIGQIPEFDRKVATIRSRNMSVSVVLQNLAQLKNLYRDTWENITGNCDSFLYLGGMEENSLKYVSNLVGKETIDVVKYSKTYGGQGSYSKSFDKQGRDLIMPDEVGNLDNDLCILKIRGVPAFKSRKLNATKHKNYQLLAKGKDDPNWYVYHQETQLIEQFLQNVKHVEVYHFDEINKLAS